MEKIKFSIWFFVAVIALTAAGLVMAGMDGYRARQSTAVLLEQMHRGDQVKHEILFGNGQLLASARAAVVTGDASYYSQYMLWEERFAAGIERAHDVFPAMFRGRSAALHATRKELTGIERHAMGLPAEGNMEEAKGLIFERRVDDLHAAYVRHIERLSLFIKQQLEERLAFERSREHLAYAASLTLLVILLLAGLILLRITRRFQDALVISHGALRQRTAELDNLNRTLDDKVKERTRRLSDALIELQNTHMDLKTAQNQLLQSEKFSAIGQLAAGVAHEINNPIGFINSNLQTLGQYVKHYTQLLGILNKLEKALKDDDKVYVAELVRDWQKTREETNFVFIGNDIGNLINESLEGSEKIRKIVLDLRAFASPDKGTIKEVDLRAIMESMLNIVWNELKYKVTLEKDYGDVPLVTCNPQKIGQVFVNLLMNAAHAIKEKGTVLIRIYTMDGFIYVEVKDSGCGIRPENITKIFDPFFTTKPPGQGVGLGLSLSYDIIKKHGGQITFTSRVGQGTTFTVMMPVTAAGMAAQM